MTCSRIYQQVEGRVVSSVLPIHIYIQLSQPKGCVLFINLYLLSFLVLYVKVCHLLSHLLETSITLSLDLAFCLWFPGLLTLPFCVVEVDFDSSCEF